jgi:hypothetical protein
MLKEIYLNYLFEKHILVCDRDVAEQNSFEVLFTLANMFNIRIDKGAKYAQRWMINYASEQLGQNVPEPFYKGFPQSVRELTSDQLLFDQLFQYVRTYGMGDFSEAGQSLFEENFDRIAFKEEADIKVFSIVTEDEAYAKLVGLTDELLMSTRPLSDSQYELVKDLICSDSYEIKDIASKNTCIRLLVDLRDLRFAKFLYLSDVIKVVDEINYAEYGNKQLNKLNLKNVDRKFLTKLINALFDESRCDIRNCYERKKIWNGLLHHIHYKAVSDEAKSFVDAMRSDKNESVFSEFERSMNQKSIKNAVDTLKRSKGASSILRNLNYIISRCDNDEDIDYVLKSISTDNTIVLLQVLMQYAHYKGTGARAFKFTKHNKLKVHVETDEEKAARRSVISADVIDKITDKIREDLKLCLKGRLGKVYIDPDMVNYALPLQENTSQGGFGTLTRGSKIRIGETKKLRVFTYWEKVNDIDLSVFGIDEYGNRREFSWRTMANNQSKAITYSGDQTSGYNGGSEYFDIDMDEFRKLYPDTRYMILCDNVFSGSPFSKCFCKAGYMTRDINDSGQVYEPKTVKTAFMINCDSTFAYLFGVDLKTNELIWLNTTRDSSTIVAGDTEMDFLLDYFDVTDTLNVYSFFEMMADEVVSDINEAQVIVTDKPVKTDSDALIIREFDTEKMIAYLNN